LPHLLEHLASADGEVRQGKEGFAHAVAGSVELDPQACRTEKLITIIQEKTTGSMLKVQIFKNCNIFVNFITFGQKLATFLKIKYFIIYTKCCSFSVKCPFYVKFLVQIYTKSKHAYVPRLLVSVFENEKKLFRLSSPQF
jgi:hypothetical protein